MRRAAATLTIELVNVARPAGQLIVLNGTRDVLRTWEMGNSWGNAAWLFELLTETDVRRIARLPQRYTRNVPAYRQVMPGTAERLHFDLGDGTWQLPDLPLDAPGARLVGIYEPAASPEAAELRVFMGPLRSAPVALVSG